MCSTSSLATCSDWSAWAEWESWDAADAWLDWLRGEFDDARRLAVERWERAHPVEAEMRRVDEARYDAQHGLGAPWGGDAA